MDKDARGVLELLTELRSAVEVGLNAAHEARMEALRAQAFAAAAMQHFADLGVLDEQDMASIQARADALFSQHASPPTRSEGGIN